MRHWLLGIAVLSPAVLAGVYRCGEAEAASFDCTKASNIAETLICTNPNLSQMDDKLAAAYSTASSKSANPEQLLADERAWISHRDQCQTLGCVSDAYTKRLAELEGEWRATPNPDGTASQSQAREQSSGNWYYCDPAHAYYPYVSTCAVPWREVVPNPNAYGRSGSQQPETNGTTSSPLRQGEVDRQGWKAWFAAYWETTGVGGVFMGLGVLLLILGMGSLITTPTRIETRSGGPGVVLRTKYPGYTPTESDIRRGRKFLLWGLLIALFGACITYGPTVVYNTLHTLFLKAIG
jgi:uncharacterized protein